MTQKRRTFKKSRHTSRSATGEHTGPPPACIATASVFAPSIRKDASKVPSPNSLAFSRALASLASPASASTTILPSSLRLAPSHADFVDTPPRAKRRSSTPAHRARPTVTPAFAVAIPRPRRGLRARAYASPSASPRSLARVAVGRRHPRVHFFQPLARFIALYRTLSHNLPPRACTFARDFLGARLREIHESRLVSTRVWTSAGVGGARGPLRTPVCRAARGGARGGRSPLCLGRAGWTREARRRRAWDGGGRYIVSRRCV